MFLDIGLKLLCECNYFYFMGKRTSLVIWAIGVLIILYGGGVMFTNAQQGVTGDNTGAYIFIFGWLVILINKAIARYQRTPDW